MGFDWESMKIKKIFFGIGIHSTRWKHAGFMSLPIYMEGRAIRFIDRKYTRFVVSKLFFVCFG